MLAPRLRVVVALFIVTSCIATAVSTLGVFLPVLSDAFGWSRGAVSVVLSIHLVLGGLAAAIVLSGFNRGWRTGGPLAAFLISHWGWRTAYVGLGALVAAVGLPASFSVRYPRSSEPRRVVPGTTAAARRSVFGDTRLWFFVAAWSFLGLVFMMVTVHSVSYARDRGLPLEQASLALSAFGIGAVSGRLLAGAAADRFGAVPIMRVCLLVQLTALCALLIGLPTWTIVVTLLFFGLGASGADNTFVKAVSDVFGL